MHKDYFWIDGVRCDDFGVRLQAPVTFDSAEPNIEGTTIPGRNGVLYHHDGSFANVSGSVNCFALEKSRVYEALNAFSRFCLLHPGYHRLEVSNEPEYYRMARIGGSHETEIRMKLLAPFSVKFDCKPQKFLKDGERKFTVANSGTVLYNKWFPSLPVIDVHGTGVSTLYINDCAVKFNGNFSGTVTLDCETQNAFDGYDNRNNVISAADFPVLENGQNTVAWDGGITKIEIIPRWWTL